MDDEEDLLEEVVDRRRRYSKARERTPYEAPRVSIEAVERNGRQRSFTMSVTRTR